MYWSKTRMMSTQKRVFSKGWAIVGIMGVLTGLAMADWPSSRGTVPQEISTMDIVLLESHDSAAAEPNTTIPATEPPNPKIMGEVVVLGKPVPGVLIVTDNGGGVCVTDSDGYFTVEVPHGWSSKLTPAKEGWMFDPPSRHYQQVCQDVNERCHRPVCLEEEHPMDTEQSDLWSSNDLEIPAAPPAWGRLGVSPMVISREARPGQTVNASLSLQNMGIHPSEVTVALADLTQLSTGAWMPTEPNADNLLTNTFSCRSWLALERNVHLPVSLSALDTANLPFVIQVPPHAQGFYRAALVVQPTGTANTESAINCSLVVPVLVNVEQDRARDEVTITDIDFIVPFIPHTTGPPRVRLSVQNQGSTLCRFAASATATTPASNSGQAMVFSERWIMPGASLVLETNYTGPFPDQLLSLHGQLDLIKEHFFTKRIPVTPASAQTGKVNVKVHTLTEDPAQTVAMLDYSAVKTLRVHQNLDASDPSRSYRGQCHLGVVTNFNASIHTTVQPCSPAQGNWTASASPATVNQPTHVLLEINGTKVATERLPGGHRVTVGKFAVQIIPEIDDWRPTSR
jgi:hypothetical protein